MFNLYKTTFTFYTSTAGYTSADGVSYQRTEASTIVNCFFYSVSTTQLALVGGNIVKGQLEVGDAVALVKDTATDWKSLVKVEHHIEKDGLKYKLVDAIYRPRNYISLMLKRLKG